MSCIIILGIFNNTAEDLFIKYENLDMGFKMDILLDMSINNDFGSFVTKIENEDININIFYDDFTNQNINFDSYINYSNKFIENTKYHNLIEKERIKINGKDTNLLVYSRKKLSKLKNDKNYYCSAEIKLNDNKVYTILAKTSEKNIEDAKKMIESFEIIGKVKEIKLKDKYFKNIEIKKDLATMKIYDKYFSKDARLTWGIFHKESSDNSYEVKKLEEKLNYDFKFLIKYQGLGKKLPIEEINNSYKEGKITELTLQTMNTVNNEIDVYEILDGKYDNYFNEYAESIKELKIPILFRLDNEMNGDWCHYCAYYFSKDSELYREMWKYIYNIFEEHNVNNVLWVWNPNYKSFPNFSWNNYLMYYPGDEFVDIIGLTAYNTGTYYKGENWQSFDELYSEVYEEYTRIFEKPLMITEFSSSTIGGDKILWVENMFESIKKYPNIKVMIWWDHIDYDSNGNEARIYKLDRPKELLKIFNEKLQEYR